MGEFIKLNGRVNRTANRRALKISEREEQDERVSTMSQCGKGRGDSDVLFN